MSDKPSEMIGNLIERISNWLEINRENQKAVKPLTEILEVLQWAKETIDTMPSGLIGSFPAGTFLDHMTGIQTALDTYLPPIQQVNVSGISSVASTTGSVTTDALLMYPGDLGGSGTVGYDWYQERSQEYRKIQEKQEKSLRVRALLSALQAEVPSGPDLIEEFDNMTDKIAQSEISSGVEDVSAGIAMRNLLDHYKGKIYEAARHNPKENMTWEKMVGRLSTFSPGTIAYNALLSEEATWSKIKSSLSDIAKNRTRGSISMLNIILLTHLFTVLSLITL